jgi:hypothetical protein
MAQSEDSKTFTMPSRSRQCTARYSDPGHLTEVNMKAAHPMIIGFTAGLIISD